MKKIIKLFFITSFVLVLSGCGNSNSDDNNDDGLGKNLPNSITVTK